LCGNLNVARILVGELGADVNQLTEKGCAALHLAVKGDKVDMVRVLVRELGADVHQVDSCGHTPLAHALKAALYLATQRGAVSVMQCLIKEFGADVNQKSNGTSALFVAAFFGNLDVIRCLVKELGADINQPDISGRTPLMAASYGKHEAVAAWLIKNGANAQAMDDQVRTAADISKEFGAPAEQTAYLKARTHCANPGCSGAGLKKCAVCLEVFFCSKDCQVAHWPAHKAECKRRAAAKAKAAKGK
jgi:ankyrin repeat protein